MEANLLKRLFTSDDYEHNEYKKRQINYINDMLVRISSPLFAFFSCRFWWRSAFRFIMHFIVATVYV